MSTITKKTRTGKAAAMLVCMALMLCACLGLGIDRQNLTASAADTENWIDYAEAWTVTPGVADGTSEAKAFIIETAGQLAQLAVNVNGGTNYASAFFKLAGGIDLAGKEWTAIGFSTSPLTTVFRGSFDGCGFAVKNMKIDKPDGDYQGLFGYISGTVKNLTVSGSVRGKTRVGGIIGSGSGTISGCVNLADVEAADTGSNAYAGGIIGYNGGAGTIINCVNAGAVTAAGSYAGGIVGGSANSNRSIKNCINTGAVTAAGNYAGGIAGYIVPGTSGAVVTVENCYNTGAVTGGSIYAGGICGYFSSSQGSEFKNCYSRGTVSGGSTVGGVAGQLSDVTALNCYYDTDVIVAFTQATGKRKPESAVAQTNSTQTDVKGLTTAQMTGLTAIGANTMNFTYTDPDTVALNLVVKENASEYLRYYPQLKALVDLGGEFVRLSLESVTLDTRPTPSAPATPTVSGTHMDTSITLTTIAGAEYAISGDGGASWRVWQDSPVFTGLTANTEYTFIARIKETVNNHASASSAETKIKTAPSAPSAPTVSGTPTATSITLNTIAGAEYSKDNGATWQDSPTFTGLTPNTDYTFVARIKETTDAHASPKSADSAAIKTDKSTPAAPAAPTVSGAPSTTSITLTAIAGAEYSKDNGTTWQDSPTFTGLTANTEYTFIARIKATTNSYVSASSAGTKIKTDKSTPAAPAAPTVSGTPTATSITLNTIAGAEYSKDNGATWQDSPTFTGLTSNTDYTFVARIKETTDAHASPKSADSAAIKTDKSTPAAPAAPTVSGTPATTSITLTAIAGAEYSKDNGTTWQDSPTFTGLTANTEYTFIARIKATTNSYVSASSAGTKIKTDKTTPSAPAAPTVSGTPTATSITLTAITGAEYSKDNGTTWQDNPTFTGLTPNTDYTFVARIKETTNAHASPKSAASAAIKTDKSTPAAPAAPTVSGTPATTSITLNTIAGAEYSKDNGTTWQDSPTFTGLTANIEYTFIARIKATTNSYVSASSAGTKIKTDKSTPAAPAAPALSGAPGKNSVTVETVAGAEYSIDGGATWQDSSTFDGLEADTEYTVLTRLKATDNAYASAASEALTFTTLKDGLSGGAIAGIVIGSVLVVGLGGFAIFWFIIKKKKFADLIAVFKKNPKE